MRRLVSIAAFGLLLAMPLWAQRSGGHAGGGHASGFAGHSGFSASSGTHFSGGMHSAAGMHSAPSRGFNRGPSFSQPFSHRGSSRDPFLHHGFHGTHFHTYGLRNNCYGYNCRGYGYPWAWGGYYDPFWWGDSSSSYDEDYERDRAIANEMNQQSLDEQRMRQQDQRSEADAYQDPYAGQNRFAASSASSQQAESASIVAPTVLIFHDQRKIEIRNYAIVGQTLWNFAPQRTEKIPLSDLDLAATVKANEDRGLTFRVPTSNEGQ